MPCASDLGTWLLKSFRGLICEKKHGGWELSAGRVMAWLLFWKLLYPGDLDVEWIFYSWVSSMGYCSFTKTDIGKLIRSKG